MSERAQALEAAIRGEIDGLGYSALRAWLASRGGTSARIAIEEIAQLVDAMQAFGPRPDEYRERMRLHDLTLEVLAAWQESDNYQDDGERRGINSQRRTILRERLRPSAAWSAAAAPPDSPQWGDIDLLHSAASWIEAHGDMGHQTPWLVLRDAVFRAAERLRATPVVFEPVGVSPQPTATMLTDGARIPWQSPGTAGTAIYAPASEPPSAFTLGQEFVSRVTSSNAPEGPSVIGPIERDDELVTFALELAVATLGEEGCACQPEEPCALCMCKEAVAHLRDTSPVPVSPVEPTPPAESPTTKRCDVCGAPATREFCYPADPWVPYCGLHCPQYATVGERQLKPVEPTLEPPTETRCVCPECEPVIDPVPQPSADDLNRLEKVAWDSRTDLALVWYRDQIEMYRRRLRETERAWQLERKQKPTGAPAPCVWRPIKEGSAWLKATCRDSALPFLPAKAHEFAGCPYCLKPLTVER